MYAYSKRYIAKYVYLVYPELPATELITRREYKANGKSIDTVVALHFLNLKNVSDFAGKGGSLALSDENNLYHFLGRILKTEAGAEQTILMA